MGEKREERKRRRGSPLSLAPPRARKTRKRQPTMGSLIANKETFQHMIRVANTNIDGKQKAGFALTSIKGIGRRFCDIALKKAEIDVTKRAGELSQEEIDQFMVVVSNPRTFKIPDYVLNRRKDFKDGRYAQIISS